MTNPDERDNGAGGKDPLEPALEELRARLAADLAAVLGAVASLSQAQADWRPAPDRWTVGEVLHHIVLSNRSFARVVGKLVEVGRREGPTVPPKGRRSWPRLRSFADASASGPVKNPDRVTPSHGLPIEQLKRDLVESHHAVVEQIPALSTLEMAELRFPHPLGFELNLYHWVDIAGAHEHRHLAQIQAVMAAPGFPLA
ncbi:MAG: DinB family protein [Acidobacteriia bacterium]|nr:DinB family protein [Terriglobia bacterium]